ncbi:terpenoid synthase [Multifurca ochricompacta]|uniref:Terpene synthase n=1 Tax=Multifurca ochricompacta TaxID=376703 RepID=A0AAD4LXM1_9AGAM|nr:terpenoid synthase [Multifurca ochricompacta]
MTPFSPPHPPGLIPDLNPCQHFHKRKPAMSNTFYIPNVYENWKWSRRINPHYLEVKAETAAWIRSFGAFSPKVQAAYDLCDFCLLASLTYPNHDKARLRTACNLMSVFLLCDEYSDVADEDEVQGMVNITEDVLRNPHTPRPKGEWIGGEITRQFWEMGIKTASPQSQKRFIETFGSYMQAVVQHGADRTNKHIPTIEEYFEIRRYDVGTKPSFAVLELEMDLPDEAVNHPAIQELSVLATDMIILDNDTASYNVEQARGDDNYNIITIVMNQNKTDIQGAMNWVYEHHKELEEKFMDIYENKIPKFGEPVDEQLVQYVDGIGNWVRANDQWDFETERYFGKKGLEIQRTRWVTLLPKKYSNKIGPQYPDCSKLLSHADVGSHTTMANI